MLSKLIGRFARCLFKNPYFRVYLRDFVLTEVAIREQDIERKKFYQTPEGQRFIASMANSRYVVGSGPSSQGPFINERKEP